MKKFFLRVAHWPQGLEEAVVSLRAGRDRHDVLESMIRVLELDPTDDSVGYGGYPNILGEMELDAAFMDGNARNCGAVAGIRNRLPVMVARRLMEKKLHTLLIGAGAETFAQECGLKTEPTLNEAQRRKWECDVKPLLDNRGETSLMDLVAHLAAPIRKNFDTTMAIASDGTGLSGAASTAGWPYKYPGRVGDTPIPGAGLYVDSRYGACACTWTGEMSTRAGTARYVVAQLERGKSAQAAAQAGLQDVLCLKDGVLRTLVIHVIDRAGDAHVVALNAEKPISYQYWREDLAKPELRQAEMVSA